MRISKKIRPAAVASLFYPGDSKELRDLVQTYLKGNIDEQKKIKQKFDILTLKSLLFDIVTIFHLKVIIGCMGYQ